MIKTIDDLRKCYAVRADKEVFELFMDKCEELGITWSYGRPGERERGEAVVFDGAWTGKLSHGDAFVMECHGYKRLTLSDFKPTRTEYVQVAESIFDLRESLEIGELYERHVESIESTSLGKGSGVNYGYSQITSELDLFKLAVNGDAVYRRVEKVVDWTADVMGFLGSELQRGERVKHADVELFCNGSKFINLNASLPKDRFLEMCRVALRANGEIE